MRLLPAILLLGLASAGCGDKANSPVPVPSYDAQAMGKAAVSQLDKNGNGTVEGAELDACPGLKAALPNIDTNHDNKLSAEELTARFLSYRAAGAVGSSVRVTLDGAPLIDATVTFTPEAFMCDAISEATAQTGADGTATNFTANGRTTPGLASGVYRVAVTRSGVNIPAKFNTQTTLGCEVSAGGRGGSSILELKLTSR